MNAKKEIKRIHFEEIGSTNDYAKGLRVLGEDLIVTATRQTGGRGTKGRSFSSGEGGVYLSELRFYENFLAKDAFKIMARAAVAVCETLKAYGLQPVIKWVNDIYVNDKKICGILIENVFSGARVASSVVGIGLNVHNALPEELAEIATTMQAETGRAFSVDEVRKRLLAELEKPREMEEYLAYIGYMGREATLIIGDERVPATLLFVDNEGGLHVRIGKEEKRFAAAEVSLKL